MLLTFSGFGAALRALYPASAGDLQGPLHRVGVVLAVEVVRARIDVAQCDRDRLALLDILVQVRILCREVVLRVVLVGDLDAVSCGGTEICGVEREIGGRQLDGAATPTAAATPTG